MVGVAGRQGSEPRYRGQSQPRSIPAQTLKSRGCRTGPWLGTPFALRSGTLPALNAGISDRPARRSWNTTPYTASRFLNSDRRCRLVSLAAMSEEDI